MKITVAIPRGKMITVVNMLRKEESLSANIKSDETRRQVQKGLRAIIARASDGKIFWFDGETQLLETVDYDDKPKIYFCGDEFIQAPEKPKHSYLMIAIDASECTIGLLKGKEVKTLWHETSLVSNHHKNGGYSAARYQRNRNEEKKQWYRKCGQKLKDIIADLEGAK